MSYKKTTSRAFSVAEEANFTRAAQRVHISQSGVSAQIRQLEHELGAALLDRSGRTASLTAAGAAALDHARAALAATAAVREAVDQVQGLVRGRIDVGMVASCTVEPFFAALAGFHHEYPAVEITLAEDTSDRLRDRVRAGALELALVGISAADAAEPRLLPVLGEPLIAAVAPTHPLADRPRVTLAELAPHPLVCLPTGTGIRAVFDQACAAAHLHPQVRLQAAAPRAVADLAARGLGVAILSASMTAEHGDRLRALPIEDVTTPALLALVWAGGPHPALPELLRHCRQAFAAAAAPDDVTG
ncbi:LysR family transcriptional regulator [Frankia sp. AgB32]|uniref:LysR family transcriptional regulator n=1 Tax=Frankia sp. AgB32 TaxID=631119 RepID=UPI00200C15DA|nr:LysR family transcriptional regulator [Frankia sp. AgB32]MCK9893361.1 LysR family transcriptional regulator [Frankia sp. AgB32]